MRTFFILSMLVGLVGCATASLADGTARAIGLSPSDTVTISDESGNSVMGYKYYTATIKNGDVYNCSIFSNIMSNPPVCKKRAK